MYHFFYVKYSKKHEKNINICSKIIIGDTMKAFNLIGEVQKLIDELNEINLSNAFSVLEWFYKAIDYNSMFEDRNISGYVFDTLKGAGYQPMLDPVKDLASFKQLMNSANSVSELDIANALIRQIMYVIRESHSLSMTHISLVQAFNEKYNKQFAYDFMMKNLKECIGEKIVYTGMKNGEYFIQTGVLTYVSDFKFFTVNGVEIELFGEETAILTIQSSTGKILFSNNMRQEEPRPEKNVMQFT